MNQEKLRELEQKINQDCRNIAGIVVLKGGKSLYEKYFSDCTADSKIHVYSVTKSIISILIGIAIDKGYIDSIDRKVLDFFPDYKVKQREKIIQQITLRHLLTMTAPYKYKSAPYIRYFTSKDWVTFSLDLLGGRGQIGQFLYAPLIGPDILSGILAKATGQSVLEFATENLFTPLSIFVAHNITFHSKDEQLAFYKAKDISGWVTDSNGINAAGWGLTLSATDMAKIGQLYLNNGAWNNNQIVSADWVAESTKEHSRWEYLNLPYGYLWWVESGNGFAAMGDGGNVIYVNTRKGMVVAIASFFLPNIVDRLDFIKAYIEPIFENCE